MLNIIFPKRFSLAKYFALTYLLFSFLVRTTLYVWSLPSIDFSIINLLKIIALGFLFDIGSLSYIMAIYAIYLLFFPRKYYGKWVDKIITNGAYALILFVIIFSFLAEITFWEEYQKRFNFIAVDYLLYTYEVVQNINQSFPIPLIISIIIVLTAGSIKIAKHKNAFKNTFKNDDLFGNRLIPALLWIGLVAVFQFNIKNEQAEQFTNQFENEISKSGLYSFFAAYNSNELNYNEFYQTIPSEKAFKIIRTNVTSSNDVLAENSKSIKRTVTNIGEEQKPNVIFIGLESVSATFMNRFGNEKNIIPTIDSLATEAVFFTNLQATGTRTIRGLEAFVLAIPPTPGRSIVKRENNDNLFTIGEVFKQKGYSRTFFYGGDSHFDNMNVFFGGNGFDIVDRKKSFRVDENVTVKRTQIADEEVTFENAWGVCDGDLFSKVLKIADEQYKQQKPFFNFIMTSTNHKPYTYPDGIVSIPSGKNRDGALQYTDWAIKNFISQAKTKPWFNNTVFVFSSDHCAYSAGRDELNVKSYHIPAFIFNLKNQAPQEVNKLCSQIDIFPTLFGYLNWNYESNVFGKDISKMTSTEERALIANHRKLALLKGKNLLILNDKKNHQFYNWNSTTNELTIQKTNPAFLEESISYYQTAFDLFKNGGLKLTP